jgi:hypothetical protein
MDNFIAYFDVNEIVNTKDDVIKQKKIDKLKDIYRKKIEIKS